MLEHGMRLATSQTATMSQRQIQSISILQMDMAQLEEYLTGQMEENPVIDQASMPPAHTAALPWEFEGSHAFFHSPSSSERGNSALTALDYAVAADESATLQAFLRDQLERRKLPTWQLPLCIYITGLLDERGYLTTNEVEALYRDAGLSPKLIDRSITLLQSLEPAGIAARDLQDCLLLQLDRMDHPCETAVKIVKGYLNELAQKRYSTLSKKLHKPIEEIYRAADQIRSLNPKPGSAFYCRHAVQYVRPDAVVVAVNGNLQVSINDGETKRFILDEYYMELEKKLMDPEAKAYLQEKISQAKWLFTCLQQRHSTLEACIRCIVEKQRDFFAGNSRQLLPMTLADIATQVDLHESTVCRALQGKYLLCRDGVLPLNHFFSNPVTSSAERAVSAAGVKEMISVLIKNEDKCNPLSDQQIQEVLEDKEHVLVSRRTVAKYRTALRIPPANERRAVSRAFP